MVGEGKASLTTFGARPDEAGKVLAGVKAISRLTAAATKVWERQCGGNISHKCSSFR